MRKSCVWEPSNTIVTSVGSSREPLGTVAKKSSTRVRRSRAVWTSMNPAPPGPVSGLSVAQDAKPAATQASTAFPPRSRTRAPTSAVSGWPAAIAPFMDRAYVPIRRYVRTVRVRSSQEVALP
jgi:hypothetical protein